MGKYGIGHELLLVVSIGWRNKILLCSCRGEKSGLLQNKAGLHSFNDGPGAGEPEEGCPAFRQSSYDSSRLQNVYQSIPMPNPNRGSVGFQSNEFEQEYERPSKSQLKREMTALQKLGEDLVAEAKDRVKRVPMPEDVRAAILECQKIKDHEGRRRQLQYVGKKMRTLTEEEVAVIQRTLDSWRGASKAETAAMHALERRREKLLASDAALTELKSKFPQADVQQLRTLIRNARKEQAENKPPKAYREIFQILKQLQSNDQPSDADQNDEPEEES
jgi:ribosome-associated protein